MFADYKEFKGTVFFGTYLESTRIARVPTSALPIGRPETCFGMGGYVLELKLEDLSMRLWSIALLCTLAACATGPNPKMVAVESTTTGHCAADADCGQSQLCVDSSCHDVLPVSACAEMPVHFTTNSSAIDSQNRGELNSLAVCLRANRDVRVTVAGNADERGAPAHNEVLANERAKVVSDYLQAAGVPSKQVATVAFGTRDPKCEAHDASCWKQNRRSDITASDTASTTLDDSARSKTTTGDIAKGNRRVDGTGNGSDNGTSVGK